MTLGNAYHVVNTAIRAHQPAAVFAMFSGGHDSLVATAIASRHSAFTAAVHINTGVGIADTREFVRSTCAERGWPLLELHPDGKTYADLVREKGMPAGPKAHNTMYYWLKQRQVRRLVREHKRYRSDRVVLVTGIRTAESQRRMQSVMAQPVHRIGAQVWVNPILEWSAGEVGECIAWYALRRNPVSDALHRSGECMCGALASPSERPAIAFWYPEFDAELRKYEALAREHGHLEDVWARPLGKVNRRQLRMDMPLCHGCAA